MSEAVTVERAIELIEACDFAVDCQLVPLAEAQGRTIAEDIFAPMDQPPFNRSPLDGYAFRSEDVAGASKDSPARLKVLGRADAGSGDRFTIDEGQALRLMTGAPIPEGADAVIGWEHTDNGLEQVEIYKAVKHFENYVFKGEDFRKGSVLLQTGTVVDAAAAAVLAMAGIEEVRVLGRPDVAIIVTGSEISRPGTALSYGKIYDSNSVYISQRLRQMGIESHISFVNDDEDFMASAIKEAVEMGRLVITTGGVSVGDKDLVPPVLQGLGAKTAFKGVRLKPGSPAMMSTIAGVPVLSLSGNPFAAAATFELFGRPLLSRVCREAHLRGTEAYGRLEQDFKKGSAVPRYVRARLRNGLVSVPDGHSSGQLASMVGASCLACLEAGAGPTPAGTLVKLYMF